MRLTIDEQPDQLRRYGHVRPASGRGTARCKIQLLGTTYSCSRERGHSGPHVAHGRLRRVVAAWDASAGAPVASRESVRNRAKARGQGGLPSRRSGGVLEAMWARTLRVLSDPEQLFLLILFLAFAGFAVDWMLRIIG